jgi:uncharacterized protein (DUF2384 family)
MHPRATPANSPPAAADEPRQTGEERQRLAMMGFVRIMELWGVGNAEMRRILGSPPERTFYEWKAGRTRRLPEDTIRRIGYVAGIYKALQILYSDPADADAWVKKPNRSFGGQTPLERMTGGDVTDLAAVRSYLDAARSPWS